MKMPNIYSPTKLKSCRDMKSNLYYPKEVWSFKGFQKEINKLCKALERIRLACQSMAKTFEDLGG